MEHPRRADQPVIAASTSATAPPPLSTSLIEVNDMDLILRDHIETLFIARAVHLSTSIGRLAAQPNLSNPAGVWSPC